LYSLTESGFVDIEEPPLRQDRETVSLEAADIGTLKIFLTHL